MLLWSGIGDTIRVSLSADPVEEVKAGFEMLKSLNLRRRGLTVISCPSCARQQFEVIKTVERLEERLAHITTPHHDTADRVGHRLRRQLPGRGPRDRYRLYRRRQRHPPGLYQYQWSDRSPPEGRRHCRPPS
jgi:GcpE protein